MARYRKSPIGGFGLSSEFTAQGFAAIGYKRTDSISTALGYRAIYTDYRDATAGVRYQRLTAQLKATPGLIPITISRGRVEDWADPTVGLAVQWRLSDRWFVNVLGDRRARSPGSPSADGTRPVPRR